MWQLVKYFMVVHPFVCLHTVRVCNIHEGQSQALFFDCFYSDPENIGCSDLVSFSKLFYKFDQVGVFIFPEVYLIGFIRFVFPSLLDFVAGGGFAGRCNHPFVLSVLFACGLIIAHTL